MTIIQDIQRHVGVTADGVIGPQTLAAIAKALGLHSAAAEKHISQAGLNLIREAEGEKLKAYQDTGGVWTVGVGHTGSEVKSGMVITQAQSDAFLRADLAEAEADVRRLFPITTQGQFDALVSFCFNLGANQVATSTLRRKHNDGDYDGAANEFARWVFDDGVKLNGLIKRRAAEAKLYRGQA